MLVSHIVGEEFESCVVWCMRDSGVGSVAPLGMGSSGVLLFGAMGRRLCQSAGVLVLEVLFFGVLVFDDVFADVLIVVVSFVFAVVDVSVAKVMKSRVFWRLSSGARSSSGCGGFEKICLFFVVAMWQSWRVVLTGEQGGRLVPAIHNWSTGTVPSASRRRVAASFVWGRVDVVGVESSKVLSSPL